MTLFLAMYRMRWIFALSLAILSSCAPPPGALWWSGRLASTSATNTNASTSANPADTSAKTSTKSDTAKVASVAKPDSSKSIQDSAKASARAASKANSKEKSDMPLVCEANPGTAQGSGQQGSFILEGHVVCDYGRLHFTTARAVWDTHQERVFGEGGMEVELDEFHLLSQEGGYSKKDSLLWARRDVRGRDTSGQYAFEAGLMHYYRSKRNMVLYHKPVLRRFTKAFDSTFTPPKRRIDTLTIFADTIRYADSTRHAFARNHVIITRGDLNIHCDSAEYTEASGKLRLVGKPVVKWGKNMLSGENMWIGLNKEDLTYISIKGNALGLYESRSDSGRGELQTQELKSDSLYMKIGDKKLEYMEMFEAAQALSHGEKSPDKKNKLAGQYLRIDMKDELISAAKVYGHASSNYYHYDKETYKGQNWASGDSIKIDFKKGKLNEIQIDGSAAGSYLGQKEKKKPIEPDSSKVDSRAN